MRILTLSNMYPPHHLGGYELSCWDVMRRLEARGHEVLVLTTDMRVHGVLDDPAQAGKVLRSLHFYWDDHELVSPPVWRRAQIERRNHRELAQVLDTFRPDVVSVWNMGAMSLGLLSTVEERRLPMVLAVCDDWLVYGPQLDAWMRLFRHRPRVGRVARTLIGPPTALPSLKAGAYCFVSDFTRRSAVQRGFADVSVSTVVYSGIEGADFPPPAKGPTDSAWRWRLLYVGRIDNRKGLETLIRAVGNLSEASLDIIGRGGEPYVESLRTLTREVDAADRIRFAAVERSELAEHYRAADAVVFPSEWEEPFGLVPVEAMACGTPVVATGRGGSAEFLRDGVNCVLFPAGDAASLAQRLRDLAEDEALRGRLVAGGLTTAAELNVDRLADVFETWHTAAAERFAHGTPPDRVLFAQRSGTAGEHGR